MEDIKKTAPNSSTAIDVEQSPVNNNTIIIHKEKENFNYLKTISMTELLDNVYPPRIPIIDNFLYAGTYLFVGAPKVGKSFFMALLSYHVSNGKSLWNYSAHRGTVLYLALEDNYGRLQDRFSKMFGTDNNDDLHFATLSSQVGQGLEEQLKEFINQHPSTKLIIIDTLQKVRESLGDKFSYANDYEIVTKLKKFSDKYSVCLLLVHHTRKQTADDSFDTISGSNGLLGAADGAFILQKEKRIVNKAVLDIVGRDQQDQRLHFEFDRESFLWELTKAETEIVTPEKDPILETISKLLTPIAPTWNGTASDLLVLLGDTHLHANTLTRKLNISVERLLNEYGISYENCRTRLGSCIKLSLAEKN